MESEPAVDVLRTLLGRQLRAIRKSAPGVAEGSDPEALHRFRVAVRRSRALIRAARPLLRDQLSGLDRDLRRLGSISGPVRDLDVLIADLRPVVDALEPDRAGGEAIIAALEREREAARDVLLQTLGSEKFEGLLVRFADALPTLHAADDDVELDALARHELDRLAAAHAALGVDPPDDELHALRIKAKHARYAAELANLADVGSFRAVVTALKELQDVIGAHQDAVVAEERLRRLAGEESRVAVGRIIELERRRRLKARALVPSVWKRVERSAEELD